MKNEKITIDHGAGGKLSHEIVNDLFLPFLDNEILHPLDDSAMISTGQSKLAFTTDSFVVRPLFFPGGDIGRLSVCGTVNDLSMAGAKPLGISTSFILEEGLPLEDLKRIVYSIKEAAQEANVHVVTGDTKVVEHGATQGVFITTSGVGIVAEEVNINGSRAIEGDAIIVNGPIGDHETAILLARGEFSLQGDIKSDCAPLNDLVKTMLDSCRDIHVLRDPTRGGLATVLWEIANSSNVGIIIDEETIPLRKQVKGACDLLGFDPLYLANEGKLVAIVPASDAEGVLDAMKAHPMGKNSILIGRVVKEYPKKALLKTAIGGHRLLEPLSGGQFPRIC